jgi:hypothetical protein
MRIHLSLSLSLSSCPFAKDAGHFMHPSEVALDAALGIAHGIGADGDIPGGTSEDKADAVDGDVAPSVPEVEIRIPPLSSEVLVKWADRCTYGAMKFVEKLKTMRLQFRWGMIR